MLSSEIDLLMYSTFAVQSGESARQQRLAIVLPYVLLWSNRAVIHLDRDDSWTNPRPSQRIGRTRRYCSAARTLCYRPRATEATVKVIYTGGFYLEPRITARRTSDR
jgi:hypothetical protein